MTTYYVLQNSTIPSEEITVPMPDGQALGPQWALSGWTIVSSSSDAGAAPAGQVVTSNMLGNYATRAGTPFTINSTDSSGNVTSITYHLASGDLTTTYTYGTYGVATETTNGVTLTYTYNGSGVLVSAA